MGGDICKDCVTQIPRRDAFHPCGEAHRDAFFQGLFPAVEGDTIVIEDHFTAIGNADDTYLQTKLILQVAMLLF